MGLETTKIYMLALYTGCIMLEKCACSLVSEVSMETCVLSVKEIYLNEMLHSCNSLKYVFTVKLEIQL